MNVERFLHKLLFAISNFVTGKVMGMVWIVGGRVGGCGIESMADRIVRNGIRDGLAVNVASRSMACPFLYTVKVMLFPAILC